MSFEFQARQLCVKSKCDFVIVSIWRLSMVREMCSVGANLTTGIW